MNDKDFIEELKRKRDEYGVVVDLINYQNTDLLACL